jgi:hypothetical protein
MTIASGGAKVIDVSAGKTHAVIFARNIRNPHKDLPPFMVGQSHDRYTLLRVAAV